MTLSAFTFALTTREGDTLGLAVLSPEARYASVQLAGAKRLIRRNATPDEWKEIEQLVSAGLESGPMTAGVIHDVLAGGDEDKAVAYMQATEIESDPIRASEALDFHLSNQPIELRLRLR